MPSDAFQSLLVGIQEVRDLLTANPTPTGGLPDRPRTVRAINRASVVLLTSHFERYLRSLNEEAVDVINAAAIAGSSLPEALRLRHSKVPVESLADAQWDNRATMLSQFLETDGWLWGAVPKAQLDHERLLRFMKSPSPERISTMFVLWGVPDVFGVVTRRPHTRQRMRLRLRELVGRPHTRQRMRLRLRELVDKRNEIAHGDASTQATHNDVKGYLSVVRTFCHRCDGVLSRALAAHTGGARPW